MELSDLIDAILDQAIDNQLTVTVKRSGNWIDIQIKDRLSEIGYVREVFMDKALTEAVKQIQSFVDEAGS